MSSLYILGFILLAVVLLCLFIWKSGPVDKPAQTDDPSPSPFVGLECRLECRFPEEFAGALVAELEKRKARIVSRETSEGITVISCEARLGDMFQYGSAFRSRAHARGSFTIEPSSPGALDGWSEKDKDQLRQLFEKVSA